VKSACRRSDDKEDARKSCYNLSQKISKTKIRQDRKRKKTERAKVEASDPEEEGRSDQQERCWIHEVWVRTGCQT